MVVIFLVIKNLPRSPQYLRGVSRKPLSPIPPHKVQHVLGSRATVSCSLTPESGKFSGRGPSSDSAVISGFPRHTPRAKGLLPGTVTRTAGEICLKTFLSFPKALPEWCSSGGNIFHAQCQPLHHATLVIDALPPPWEKSCPH